MSKARYKHARPSESAASLRQRLARVDAAADVLHAQLADLGKQRRDIVAKLRRVRYTEILSFPRELLGEIFMHCVDDLYVANNRRDSRKNEMVLVLASVCSEWRAVALALAPIWSKLCIGDAIPATGNRLRTILERSRGHALEITAQGPPPTELVAHSNRWSTFDTYVEDFVLSPQSFAALQGRVASLGTLALDTELHMGQLETMAPITVFANAPSLRRVCVVGLGPRNLHIPWHQITTFKCTGGLNLLPFYEVLRAMPQVEDLDVYVTTYLPEGSVHDPTRPHPLTLLHLHTLRIENSDESELTWVNELSAPALTRLILFDFDSDDEILMRDFVTRSKCALESLHTERVHDVRALCQFLASAVSQTLEELKVSLGLSNTFACVITSEILSGWGIAMPALRRLHLQLSETSPSGLHAHLLRFLTKRPDSEGASAVHDKRPNNLTEIYFGLSSDVGASKAYEELRKLAAAGGSDCAFSIVGAPNRDVKSEQLQFPHGSLSDREL